MICQHALSLLDDFLDNELASSTAAEVKSHLDGCTTCRQAYDESRRLKELLRQKRNRDPGQDYWLETSQLILARTVQEFPADEDGWFLSISLMARSFRVAADGELRSPYGLPPFTVRQYHTM